MISIIIPTYERPRELRLVLEGLRRQEGPPLEVVVADDGSGPETRAVVDGVRSGYPHALEHVWQEDRGFRAAAARNRAIEKATGEVLVFLDGDCVPLPGFVRGHAEGQAESTYLVGERIRLDEERSAALDVERIAAGRHAELASLKERMRVSIQGMRAGMHAAQGREDRPKLLSCNFSVARRDVLAINGFDERFVGWGGEDDDFGRRLRRHGVMPRSAIVEARVLHLHHPPVPSFRGKVRLGDNYDYLHRGYFLARCRDGLEKRSMADLDVTFLESPLDARVRERGAGEVEICSLPHSRALAHRDRADVRVVLLEEIPEPPPDLTDFDIALLLEPEAAPGWAEALATAPIATALVTPEPGEARHEAILRTLDPLI